MPRPSHFPSDPRYQLATELMEITKSLNQTMAANLKQADWKANHTEVTELDRAIEIKWREVILKNFPADSILGEEQGETRGTNDYRWTLDPIDGTRSLARGVPLYGSMLALEFQGKVLFSLIFYPALAHSLTAYRGYGVYFRQSARSNWEKGHTSSCRQLTDAMIVSSGPEYFAKAGMKQLWHDLSFAGLALRTWGDCYGYYLFATGKADVMADAHLMPWDLAPVRIIGEELGATLIDLHWGDGQVGLIMGTPPIMAALKPLMNSSSPWHISS